MIEITPSLSLRVDSIASVEIKREFYANTSAAFLVVTMVDGKQHRLEHGKGGVDIYAIQKLLNEKEIIIRNRLEEDT